MSGSRLSGRDVVGLAVLGLRGRPLRAALSALGIAIGVACVVAVLGVAASSQARLLDEIEALGTNLLTVQAGRTVSGDPAGLPVEAPARIARLDGVQHVAAVGRVTGAVYRTDRVSAAATGGIEVLAADLALPATLQVGIASGQWLSPATERFPVTVLGAAAARRLGIASDDSLGAPGARPQVYLSGRWFTVIGVLGRSPLDAALDTAALVGFPVAREQLGFDGAPTRVYERSTEESVSAVQRLLARAASPEHPEEVTVSRPSDALVARAAAARVYADLLVGLGAVALLVGGLGVANVMVVAVLERRSEIGLRRALGATRAHIRRQFITESVLLALLGGATGLLAGTLTTVGYAGGRGWPPVVPVSALVVAGLGSVLVGILAGIYPAVHASRLSPAEALRSP